MNIKRKAIPLAVGRGLLQVFRFSLYVLLLLIGRVLRPIASAATVVGLIIFLFCLVFRRDMATPMWAGAALAASAVVVTVFYEALLRIVAPAGVVIISDV